MALVTHPLPYVRETTTTATGARLSIVDCRSPQAPEGIQSMVGRRWAALRAKIDSYRATGASNVPHGTVGHEEAV